MLSEDTIRQINLVPLTQVMEHLGYSILRKTKKAAFYLCPFHSETDASFKVDLPGCAKDGGLPGFHCFACGNDHPQSNGRGAMMLYAALTGLDLNHGDDFKRVVTELAKLGQITVEGDNKNGFFHRARQAEQPVDEIQYSFKEGFTRNELRALGCSIVQRFIPDFSAGEPTEEAVMGVDGQPMMRCAWGEEFLPQMLTERFNLRAVEQYITEQRGGKSYVVKSTDTYPVFAFVYQDEKGWWSRKYEPLFRPEVGKDGKVGPNYKFTWWYEGGRKRDLELSRRIYGDNDVMEALATGKVATCCEKHPVVEVKVRMGKEVQTMKKFKRLVLCSGPRDAINVYFHSDAHVCWPHSEAVAVTRKQVDQLRKVAEEVIVLYDIDRTGIEQANRLTLDCLELKTLYLPSELMRHMSQRTGKPCKDAEEYFNVYPDILKESKRTQGINEHFASLLKSAKEKMFWKAVNHRHRNEWGEEEQVYKYTLLVDRMCQFLAASGMHRYRKDDTTRFVYVSEGCKVDIIPDRDVETKAKEVMKSYLNNSLYYGDEGLLNAISTSRGLNAKTLSEIPMTDINFRSYGEDFDYFFFGNTAVRVTADEVRSVPYAQMPYMVNRKAILDEVHYGYEDMSRYFVIKPNPMMESIRKQYRAETYHLTGEELLRKKRAFRQYEATHRYILQWNTPLEKCPPLIQCIYDMSRIYWRKEEMGCELNPEERQFQDMHFVNKILGLGYMLSRYRTDTRQQMVMVTDYSVAQEGKASGRNGKSMFTFLLDLVRRNMYVSGKDYRKNPGDMAKNFCDFQLTVQSAVIIDDLDAGVDAESFYNNTSRLSVRNLYENTVRLSPEETPKMIISMNSPFDLASPSTYGRTWPIFLSDYYHEDGLSTDEERRTPETKFGYHITKGCSDEESRLNVNLMLYCLQLYFGYIKENKDVMRPPIGEEASMRLAYKDIPDKRFVEWANGFFRNPWHFGRPIALREMVLSLHDHIGVRITRSEVSSKLAKFKDNMKRYCAHMHISINPDEVYSGKEDRRKGVVRRLAWETVWGEDGYPVEPRSRTRTTVGGSSDCWYFYRYGDEPKSSKEVLTAPDEDEELKYN